MLYITEKIKKLINNSTNISANVIEIPLKVKVSEQPKNEVCIEQVRAYSTPICVRFTDSQAAFLSRLDKGSRSAYIRQSIINALSNPAVRNGRILNIKYKYGTLRDDNRVTTTLDKQTYLELTRFAVQNKIKHYSPLIRSFLQMKIETETSA